MPHVGDERKIADAERVAREQRDVILSSCPTAVAVQATTGFGKAWDRTSDGTVVIRRVNDAALLVTIADARYLPISPVEWQGFWLKFAIRG